VLVTRATDQAPTLTDLLVHRGATSIELPLIRTEPTEDAVELDRAIGGLDRYTWVIFTSANGVRFFADRCANIGMDPARLRSRRVAAIGPATAQALAAIGIRASLVPVRSDGDSLVEAFSAFDLADNRVLLPVARGARDVVVTGLTARGAIVDRVVAYETRATGDPAQARALVPQVDLITLTSASTARQLAELLGDEQVELMCGRTVASIGPVTSQTARDCGFAVEIEAQQHTIAGLVAAIEKWARSAQRR
jgi:uroporphyrinogen III methyltransferase/synthase